MQTYEKYKDSGVAWIGEIPYHWDVVSLKRSLRIKNGCDYKTIQVDEGGYPVIGSGGEFARASKYLYDGEVVLLGRKGTIDKPLYYEGQFWVVDTMFYGIPLNNCFGKYLYFQSRTIPFNRYSTNTALPSMTQTDLNSHSICLPTFAEQQCIASYLDKKCADIDKVIATQQRRIELLQELKQSTITHAVTRGLNPNVKMKDSGVEWIGEVPEHWNTLRLRFVCELRNGYTPSKANPDFWSEGTIPWYRMEDIRESGRRLNEAKQYITESAIKGGGLFEAGSFIMATTATIGEHAVLIVDSLANQRFTNLKIRKSLSHSDFNAFFFQYLFVVDDYCKTTTKTATFPAVNMEDLKNFIVCIPPLDEQKIILTYLDKRCAELDSSISKAQKEIDLLQEYKQALITEVVTGKRKVC